MGAEHRRHVSGARRLAVVLLLGFSVVSAAVSMPQTAYANQFGFYALGQSCCFGDPRYGTRAGITIQAGDYIVYSGECGEGGSNASDGAFNFIQSGWAICNGASVDKNPACSSVFLFVEYEISSVYNCYFVGTPTYGSTHKATVDKNNSNSYWRAYIDGTAYGPSGGVLIGNAYAIREMGELTDSNAGSASATFGNGTLWQRWNGANWVNVQSGDWCTLYQAGDPCGTGFWYHLGSPPNVWSTNR